MNVRELLAKINHLIEVEGIDPEQEILVSNLVDGRFENSPQLSDVDWMWNDIFESGDDTKILHFILGA